MIVCDIVLEYGVRYVGYWVGCFFGGCCVLCSFVWYFRFCVVDCGFCFWYVSIFCF